MGVGSARGVVVVEGRSHNSVVVDRSHSSVEVGIGRRRLGLGSFVVLWELGNFGAEGRCLGVGCSCSGVGLNWRGNVVWGIVALLIAVRVGHSRSAVCFGRRVEAHCCRLGSLKAILGGACWDSVEAVVAAGR